MNAEVLHALTKVMSWSGGRLDSSTSFTGSAPPDYLRITHIHNSFVAFDGGLRFFGLTNLVLPSIVEWNAAEGWLSEYGSLTAGLLFFAENVHGDQYALANNGIVHFDAEYGRTRVIGADLTSWLGDIIRDPDEHLSLHAYRAWRQQGNELSPNEHLRPKYPPLFRLGASSDPVGLYGLNRWESMRVMGDIVSQIKNLPDGTRIRLRVK